MIEIFTTMDEMERPREVSYFLLGLPKETEWQAVCSKQTQGNVSYNNEFNKEFSYVGYRDGHWLDGAFQRD